jgi:aspartate/methionine/tyrosine aminotransferase
MSLLFNPAVRDLATPPIPEVQGWAQAYDGRHGPVLDFSQAVPGYPPHAELLAWLGEASASPAYTSYGDIEGEMVLRQAYAEHVSDLYRSPVAPAEIQITSGCNQAFFAAMLALAAPGDDVILVRPFYFNHEMTLDMLGIAVNAVEAKAADRFVPSPDAVAAAIGPRTRAVVLVSPNNPTGAVYPPDVMQAIFENCRQRGIWLIVDETYRDFLADGTGAPHRLFANPRWQDNFVELYSFSKSFCIPGHRLGAVAAGAPVVEQIVKIMDNLQICAPRPAQHAVARAIPALAAWRDANRTEMARRAAAFRAALGNSRWRIEALGAYFGYVRHPFAGESAAAIAERLAGEFGIVTVPGSYFGSGQDAFLRMAFANADAATIARLESRLPK